MIIGLAYFDFGRGIKRVMWDNGDSVLFGMDPFGVFVDMEGERELESMYDQFKHIGAYAPNQMVRQFQTPEGSRVREVGRTFGL